MPLFRRRADEPTIVVPDLAPTVDESSVYPVDPIELAPPDLPAPPAESGLRVEPRREYEGSAVDRLRHNVPDRTRTG
jgi:hypothetical protein